jgi:hypothetical protein
MKRCAKCKTIKALTEFHRDRRARLGVQSRCKECVNKWPPPEIVPEGFKRCNKCEIVKATTEFWKHSRCSQGVQGRCKACYRMPAKPQPPAGTKYCSKCKRAISLNEFSRYSRNKDGLNSQCKACRSECTRRSNRKHKAKRSAYNRSYNSIPENVANRSKLTKKWRVANADRLTEYANSYYHETIKNNSEMLIEKNLRNRLHKIVKRGSIGSFITLIGCTRSEFMRHLQDRFIGGMNWNNYGSGKEKWNIDHIRPCASFDLTDPVQQMECFKYTNLQPLWSEDNREKWHKYAPLATTGAQQ